ncbi:MAG: cell envelope integrity protein TolA [Alphaproteobacteria bacterium]|jgi:hypothetical protein|nr:cell envelope integrity protein TolA [Alphaproteobacteria bacterium]
MRAPLTYSILFHLSVFVLAVYGVPWPQPDIITPSQVIEVEVVAVSETPEPQPPIPEAKPPPPPPPPPRPQPPQVAALQPPAPEPEPEPEPAPAPPKPEAKPEPKPEPPKQKPKPKKPAVKLPKPPRAKPKPPPKDDFASVLRTVEKLKKKPPPPKKKKDKSLDEQLLAAVQRHQRSPERAQRAPLGQRMTMSELDTVRRQIERCWVFPAGAKNPEDLIVEIKLELNQDGTVRRAEIVDKFRIQLDPFYRAAAESALRAVLNPRCSPLKLPPEKYSEWKSMTLGFNPRDLVGR